MLGCFCICPLAYGGVIPEGYPVDRYQTLWEHSPFTIASVQPDAAPDTGLATKFSLVGFAKNGQETLVILLKKDSQERVFIGSEPNKENLKLVSVEGDAEPAKCVVTVQKGSEVAKLKFDTAFLAAQGSANPGNPSPSGATVPPGNPGQPGSPLRVQRHLPIPSPVQISH